MNFEKFIFIKETIKKKDTILQEFLFNNWTQGLMNTV